MRTEPTPGQTSDLSTLAVAPLDAVLRVNELSRRPLRFKNGGGHAATPLRSEFLLDDHPERVPKAVVMDAVIQCGAASAGISLLERHADGASRFLWSAAAGRLAIAEQYTTPAEFSTCQVCLERDDTVLFAFPERRYRYLRSLNVAFVELVAVPLRVDERPAGTLWVAAHAAGRRFDLRDVETMSRLAEVAGLAYRRLRG